MKSQLSWGLASLFVALAAVAPRPGQGCCALPREPIGSQPVQSIRLDRQSAFLWREPGKEHMLLSVQYSGGTEEFAWIIPVESRPQVAVEKGAPFTELRKATQIVALSRAPEAAAAAAPGGGAPPSVTVLERKEEGPYDLAVLSAQDGTALYRWLKENGFHLSKTARGQLTYYIDRHYVFVAARIRTGAKGNAAVAQRLRTGTIAPMHLTFAARQLSYPLKVTAANPGLSEMELYVAGSLLPTEKILPRSGPFDSNGGLKVQAFELKPQGSEDFAVSGPAGLANPNGSFPTLRRLLPKGGKLTKFSGVLGDDQRQQDLVFQTI